VLKQASGRRTREAVSAKRVAWARPAAWKRFRRKRLDRPAGGRIALLAETALHHGIDPGAPGERYQVVVHIDARLLADPEAPGQSVLEGSTHVSAETSRAWRATRAGGDATRRGRQRRGSRGSHANHSTCDPARAAPTATTAADFPGCDCRSAGPSHPSLGPWRPTTLSNLAMLCRRHHRAVTRRGIRWTTAWRRAEVPETGRKTSARRAASVSDPERSVGTLRARNEAAGLHLHARTACPDWLGRASCGLGDQRPASAGPPAFGDPRVGCRRLCEDPRDGPPPSRIRFVTSCISLGRRMSIGHVFTAHIERAVRGYSGSRPLLRQSIEGLPMLDVDVTVAAKRVEPSVEVRAF